MHSVPKSGHKYAKLNRIKINKSKTLLHILYVLCTHAQVSQFMFTLALKFLIFLCRNIARIFTKFAVRTDICLVSVPVLFRSF